MIDPRLQPGTDDAEQPVTQRRVRCTVVVGRALRYINDTPELLSLLYDLDLLPEQMMENTRDWMRMIQLAAWHEWLKTQRPTVLMSGPAVAPKGTQ